MTGLEKMKSQILDEAGKAADVKVAEAKAQAEELIQAARTEAAREAESISRKSEAEVANYKERAASSMDLQKRSRILEAKQAVIAEVLDKAYEKVSTMEKDEYFSMLLKLVGKYALAQDGEICFSAKDLVYGGVEENCTLKAMFEAKRDELADKVNHLIFSQA